jgi:SAM-dependent methyltransferase
MKLSNLKRKLRALWISVANLLLPAEHIDASKEKWNRLAQKNARYYVLTDQGEDISEQKFHEAGQKDYQTLVKDDPLLRERLGDFGTRSVLEIGCGAGRITEFFADDFTRVCGVDISEGMIEEGGRRLSAKKNVQLFATDGLQYPFSDDMFDLVFSFIVFQHMPSVEVVRSNVEEIARVLKPGGIAKIQLRGIPVPKDKWFYGPSFSSTQARELFAGLPLRILKEEGAGERYYWLWLIKEH